LYKNLVMALCCTTCSVKGKSRVCTSFLIGFDTVISLTRTRIKTLSKNGYRFEFGTVVIRPVSCQSCIPGATFPVFSATVSVLLHVCWSVVRALVLFGEGPASRFERPLRVQVWKWQLGPRTKGSPPAWGLDEGINISCCKMQYVTDVLRRTSDLVGELLCTWK